MLYFPNAELHFRALLANRRRNMAANLEDQLIDKVRALPPEKQQEALRLLDTLATGASSEGNTRGSQIHLGGRRRNQRWLTRRHLGECTDRRLDQP